MPRQYHLSDKLRVRHPPKHQGHGGGHPPPPPPGAFDHTGVGHAHAGYTKGGGGYGPLAGQGGKGGKGGPDYLHEDHEAPPAVAVPCKCNGCFRQGRCHEGKRGFGNGMVSKSKCTENKGEWCMDAVTGDTASAQPAATKSSQDATTVLKAAQTAARATAATPAIPVLTPPKVPVSTANTGASTKPAAPVVTPPKVPVSTARTRPGPVLVPGPVLTPARKPVSTANTGASTKPAKAPRFKGSATLRGGGNSRSVKTSKHHRDETEKSVLLDMGKGADTDSVKETDEKTLEWTTGEKTLLIVFADHASLPGAPITSDLAVELTSKVSDFLSANSYGKVTLTVNVGKTIYRPAYGLGLSSDATDANKYLQEVKVLAQADSTGNYNPDDYDLYYVFFRGRPHLGWDGLAKVGAGGGWINWNDNSRNVLTDYMIYGVCAHEFGHNLGLHHATLGPSTYGDKFDVMGDGHTAHATFSAGYKRRVVYIEDDEAMSVSLDKEMATQSVRLFSHDHAKPAGDMTSVISVEQKVPWTKEECPCAPTADKYCWYPAGGYCDVPTYVDSSTGEKTCYPGADVDCSAENSVYSVFEFRQDLSASPGRGDVDTSVTRGIMLHEFDALFTQSDLKNTFASGGPILGVGHSHFITSGNKNFRLEVEEHGSSNGLENGGARATDAGCLCAASYTFAGQTYPGTCATMPKTGAAPYFSAGDEVTYKVGSGNSCACLDGIYGKSADCTDTDGTGYPWCYTGAKCAGSKASGSNHWGACSNAADIAVIGGTTVDTVVNAIVTAKNADGTYAISKIEGGLTALTALPRVPAANLAFRAALDAAKEWCTIDMSTCDVGMSPVSTDWDYCSTADSMKVEYLDVKVAVMNPATTKTGCTCEARWSDSGITNYGNCRASEHAGELPWCYTSSCPTGTHPEGSNWDRCADECYAQQYVDASGKCKDWTVCATGFFEVTAATRTKDRVCKAAATTPSGCVCKPSYVHKVVTPNTCACEAYAGKSTDCTDTDGTGSPWCYTGTGCTGAIDNYNGEKKWKKCSDASDVHASGGSTSEGGAATTFAGVCNDLGFDGSSSSNPWCQVNCFAADAKADGTTDGDDWSWCQRCENEEYLDKTGACIKLTVCSDLEHQVVKPTTLADRTCKKNTVCGTGYYVAKEASATADRECAFQRTCTADEYQLVSADEKSTNVCEKLRVCASTEYEAKAATTTSNRLCATLTPACSAFEYASPTAAFNRDRTCKWLTVCKATEYQTKAATASNDRACRALTVCKATEHQTKAASATSDRQCKALTACHATTEYEHRVASFNADRVCKAVAKCSSDEWISTESTATTDRMCSTLTQCEGESQYETQAPTAITDRHCKELTSCGNAEYQSKEPTATSDRVCTMVKVCLETEWEKSYPTQNADRVCPTLTKCDADEYESKEATATSDRTCKDLSVCSATQYISKAATATVDLVCESISTCPSTQYISKAAGKMRDVQCSDLTKCATTQYIAKAATSTSDRACAAKTACNKSQYISTAATATADRKCTALSVCGAEQHETGAPTSSSDRKCSDLTTCELGKTYQIKAPTDTTDRVCTDVHVCESGEFSSAAATLASNVVCKALSACTSKQYAATAATKTTDRKCVALTTCAAGQFVTKAATATTDQVCHAVTACTSAQFISTAATASSDQKCKKLTAECSAGYVQTKAPSTTSDRVCLLPTTKTNMYTSGGCKCKATWTYSGGTYSGCEMVSDTQRWCPVDDSVKCTGITSGTWWDYCPTTATTSTTTTTTAPAVVLAPFKVGDKVQVDWKGYGHYYLATIGTTNGGDTFDVDYTNYAVSEVSVPEARIKCDTEGACGYSPTKTASTTTVKPVVGQFTTKGGCTCKSSWEYDSITHTKGCYDDAGYGTKWCYYDTSKACSGTAEASSWDVCA